jgi:hypothetical protein
VYAHLIPINDDGAARRLDQLIGFEVLTGSKTVAAEALRLLANRKLGENVVAKGGIEPPTQGFSVLCSTN